MQTIEVAGGNLYALAAQYLNDASQWIRIAQQNGLTDPVLNVATLPAGSTVFRVSGGTVANPIGVFVLEIPDINPNATGGVPTQ